MFIIPIAGFYSILFYSTGKRYKCKCIYLFFKRDDPWLNLFQGEMIHCFCCGIRKVWQVCTKICEKLPWDDKTYIFIDHCKKKTTTKKYSMTSCSKPSWTCWKHKLRGTAHTCFHKGLQGFQLIHICKLNSLVQNLSISMKCYTKIHFYKVVYMLKRPNLINTI